MTQEKSSVKFDLRKNLNNTFSVVNPEVVNAMSSIVSEVLCYSVQT